MNDMDGLGGSWMSTGEPEHFKTRGAYEAWIKAERKIASLKQARRERIRRRIAVGLGIIVLLGALIGGLLFVEYATAAPLREPSARERGLKEPDAAPQKGVTLAEAKAACESRGGHWFEEDGGEQLPNHKIIGCLFAVPKGAK